MKSNIVFVKNGIPSRLSPSHAAAYAVGIAIYVASIEIVVPDADVIAGVDTWEIIV